MSLDTFVVADVSISNTSGPTVAGLNVGLLCAYHNHFPDRVRLYPTASVLTAMVADGFKTTEPAYLMAQAYSAAPKAPALVAIGRRALPPFQSLQLTCTDGTVGDAYDLTVVSSLGVSTGIHYENVPNQGTSLTGTSVYGTVTVTKGSTALLFSSPQSLTLGLIVEFSSQPGVFYSIAATTTSSTAAALTTPYTGTTSASATMKDGAATVTNGSTAVTFDVAQSFPVGAVLTFASEPGVYYALSAPVVSSTSATLTGAFQGPTGDTLATELGTLAGTFSAVNGNPVVTASADQAAAVNPGDSLQFTSQLGTYYTVASLDITGKLITLSNPYTGTTAPTAYASNVCTPSTAAAYIEGVLATLSNVGTPSVTGAVISLNRTDGSLTDIKDWLSNGFSDIQIEDLTADPGIATDLAAMQKANGGAWYAVSLDSNSEAEILAAAKYIEATGKGGKVGFFNSSDYGNTQTSITNDVFSELELLSITRSFCEQNNSQLLCYAGAATSGQALGMNPGTYTLAYKNLPDVPADTDTTLPENEALAINSMTASVPGPGAKNGNYYKNTGGTNYLWPGSTPAGGFMDNTIAVDWLVVNIQASVITALAALPKTPFTDIGLQTLGQAVQSILTLASGPLYTIIVPQGQDSTRPIVINVPKASSLTSTQRAKRDVSGITWSAGLQGAVQTATVRGTLTP